MENVKIGKKEGPHTFNRHFVCVEYPGCVENEDKMLKTLGGLNAISTAYCGKNRRLELRFRPDDIYCKPACGDKHKVSALLIKVTVRKKKSKDNNSMADDSGYKIGNISVLGQIETAYRFQKLCDFQYLPMHHYKGADEPAEYVYDKVVPKGLPLSSWLEEEAPYFLPPAVFSRMDTVQAYYYRKEGKDEANTPANIIGRTRRRRSGHAVFVTFDVPKVPEKSREIANKLLESKFLHKKHLSVIKSYFKDRPIWSKNALMYVTKYNGDQLKYLLPSVAYYFVTGPWRIMWVRFGYDPRTDPSSRRYQTLDYRLRSAGGLKAKIKAKRSYCNYLLPYKCSPSCQPKVSVIDKEMLKASEAEKPTSIPLHENVYIFRPGMIPPSRQMFYQYCDVLVPEIQEMIKKLPDPAPDLKCHERTGWMPPKMDDQCREIINNLITEALKKDAGIDMSKLGESKGKGKGKVKGQGKMKGKATTNPPDKTKTYKPDVSGKDSKHAKSQSRPTIRDTLNDDDGDHLANPSDDSEDLPEQDETPKSDLSDDDFESLPDNGQNSVPDMSDAGFEDLLEQTKALVPDAPQDPNWTEKPEAI